MLLENNKNKFFMLYADCFVTKGANRLSILDITNGKIYFMDSSYGDLIELLPEHTVGEIVKDFVSKEDILLFEQFLSEMIKIDVGCFTENIECFPPINKEWDSPSEITNSIIDIRHIFYDFSKIVSQLNSLQCKYMQVRFYRCTTKKEIEDIASKIKGTSILYLEIVIKYSKKIFDYIDTLIRKYTFLHLYIYSVPKEISKNKSKTELLSKVKFVTHSIDSANDCGKIDKKHFISANINSYMQNLLYNGCLNRKISIDEFGKIKNCPSMKKYYGDIFKDSLIDISRMKDFKEIWYINKSKIEVCQDCEYRCLCSDCRAFITNPDNLYSKPLKCKYNPYKK